MYDSKELELKERELALKEKELGLKENGSKGAPKWKLIFTVLIVLLLLSAVGFLGADKLGLLDSDKFPQLAFWRTDEAKELELKEKELALKEKELELTKKDPKADDSDKTEKSEKTETTKPPKKVESPTGATVAIVNASDVVVRAQPSLTAKKVASLRKGQKVYVIGESDNEVVWKQEYYTMKNVQLENGQKGWVLELFIDET